MPRVCCSSALVPVAPGASRRERPKPPRGLRPLVSTPGCVHRAPFKQQKMAFPKAGVTNVLRGFELIWGFPESKIKGVLDTLSTVCHFVVTLSLTVQQSIVTLLPLCLSVVKSIITLSHCLSFCLSLFLTLLSLCLSLYYHSVTLY